MSTAEVTFDDLVAGLHRLGLRGARIIAHTSLSSFGHVDGGAEVVVDALAEVCDTVLVPTFTFSPAARVPPEDRVPRNGADYDADPCGSADPTPFTPDLPCAHAMGVVPEVLRKRPDAARSRHPLSSFAALGADAEPYVRDHNWDQPLLPIERLHADGGAVLLLGTTLRACTAIHLGELHSGRRPFIRWAAVAGQPGIHRVRVGGCSEGFETLAPLIADTRQTVVGSAELRAMSLDAIVQATVRRLQADPLALVCPDRCRRCLDAAKGGPPA